MAANVHAKIICFLPESVPKMSTIFQIDQQTLLRNVTALSAILLSISMLVIPAAQAQTIVGNVSAGPAPYGLAIDTSSLSKFLYVANGGASSATIIDTKDHYSKTGTVPVGITPFDVAVNFATHKAYVSSFGFGGGCGFSGGGSVTAILKGPDFRFTTTTIALGDSENALGIDLNPVTNIVYVGGCRQVPATVGTVSSGVVTVINGTSDTIITTIIPPSSIPQALDDVAVDPLTNTIYAIGNFVSNFYPSFIEIWVIDGSTNQVTNSFTIAGACLTNGGGFANIADNPATNTVWLDGTNPCGGSAFLWALDGTTGAMKAAIQVPTSSCAELLGIGVDSATNIVYMADHCDHVVWVYDGSSYALVTALNVYPATCCPEDVTVDPTTNTIYVSEPDSGQVTVISGAP